MTSSRGTSLPLSTPTGMEGTTRSVDLAREKAGLPETLISSLKGEYCTQLKNTLRRSAVDIPSCYYIVSVKILIPRISLLNVRIRYTINYR